MFSEQLPVLVFDQALDDIRYAPAFCGGEVFGFALRFFVNSQVQVWSPRPFLAFGLHGIFAPPSKETMRITARIRNLFLVGVYVCAYTDAYQIMGKILTNPAATNIYLPLEIKRRAKALAESKNMSLSELIQRLLEAEGKRKRGIAHLHDRGVAA